MTTRISNKPFEPWNILPAIWLKGGIVYAQVGSGKLFMRSEKRKPPGNNSNKTKKKKKKKKKQQKKQKKQKRIKASSNWRKGKSPRS